MKAPRRYQTGTKPAGVSKGNPKEKKTVVETEAPDRERRVGTKTGIDLTKEIKQNQRPSQLPKGFNPGGYNAFQSWLQTQKIDGEPFVGNPKLNTNEGKAKYTDWAINEFNTNSPYVKQFPDNKITPQAIRDVQTFHKQSDPNVVVDEIIGSQTSNFRVPTPSVYYERDAADKTGNVPLSKKGFIPIKWGDETYVVDASKYDAGKAPSQSDFVKYDETLHGPTLQNIADPNVAKAFNKTAVPYGSSTKAPRIAPLVPKTETPIINGAQMAPGVKGNPETNVVLPLTKSPNVVADPVINNTKTNAFVYDHGGPGGSYQQQSDAWFKQQADLNKPVITEKPTDTSLRSTSIKESFNKGGKITKAPKRYAIGGKTGEWLTNNGETTSGLISGGAEVAGMGGDVIDAKSMDQETGLYKSQGAAIGSGALKGAGKGASMGAGIGTLFGPQGAAIGAAGGAVLGAGVGATVGGIRQKKATTALEKAEELAAQEEKQRAIKERYALGLNRQLTQRQKKYAGGGTVGTATNVDGDLLTDDELNASMGYVPDAGNVEKQKIGLPEFGADTSRIGLTASFKKGGYVHGPGTGTSDSVKAKIEAGSFITPAKNAKAAEKVLELVKGGKITKAPNMKKKADLDQEDGEEVKLSKGEFVFTPEQREEIISELGEDVLEALAPDAEHGEDEMKKGGLTAAKAKIILHDGTIRGKAITDKQRKYFGAISNGYVCGGKVKGYADGTTPNGVLSDDERAKLAAEEKAIKEKESAYASKAEKEKKLAEVRAEAYKKSMEAQEVRLKSKKALDEEVKRLEREYKAKKQSYDQYSRDQENLKNAKSSGGYRAQNNLYNEKEVIKKKKELLDLADKYKKDLDTRKNELNYWSNDANFNPDGSVKKTVKKTGGSGIDYMGGDNPQSKMVSKTGAEIEAATANKGKVSTAPKIGKKTSAVKETADKLTAKSPVEKLTMTDTEVVTPKSLMASETVTEDGAGNKRPSNDALIKAGLGLGKQIGGLANFVIPYKQTQLGRKLLAESGKRPVDKIDPDFQNAVNKAQANAKFGYTPEEQALIDQKNISALRSGENAARNYSGGSAGNALSMQRQAANDYFSRGLQSAIAGKNLQMNKEAQANEMINQKAAMNRQLFGDTMNAWSQNQSAGGDLVSAGLQNLMGANRLQREMAFQEKYGRNSNPYTQDYFKGLNG